MTRRNRARAPTDDTKPIDIRRLRGRLQLSQAAFARRYGLTLTSLRTWERRTRLPDAAARAYLTVISRDPDRVAAVFAGAEGKELQQLGWRELRAALDAADAKEAAEEQWRARLREEEAGEA